VLARRAGELGPPIQMCDALSRNLPKTLEVILGHCPAHGRRRFVKVAQNFPEECRFVLETLAEIYHDDEHTREQRMSPVERLAFHQARSRPVMEGLHAYGTTASEEGGTQLGAGSGDLLFIRVVERADAVPTPAGSPPRQQCMRTSAQESHSASQERALL
jgi:transposase